MAGIMVCMFRSRLAWIVALGMVLSTPAAAHGLATEVDEIAELLHLQPGMRLADVGAGDGELGEELARHVGDSGHVYLTEVSDGELRKLRKRVKRSDLPNLVGEFA